MAERLAKNFICSVSLTVSWCQSFKVLQSTVMERTLEFLLCTVHIWHFKGQYTARHNAQNFSYSLMPVAVFIRINIFLYTFNCQETLEKNCERPLNRQKNHMLTKFHLLPFLFFAFGPTHVVFSFLTTFFTSSLAQWVHFFKIWNIFHNNKTLGNRISSTFLT